MNPAWQQRKLIEFCKSKGIIVTAFSPLGAVGSSWGTNQVMNNEALKQIADAHGKTIAQVPLRSFFVLIIYVPKSIKNVSSSRLSVIEVYDLIQYLIPSRAIELTQPKSKFIPSRVSPSPKDSSRLTN